MSAESMQDVRRPLTSLEAEVVRRVVLHPDALPPPALEALRYILSLARLTTVRGRDGQDIEVSSMLARHRRWVRETLLPRLSVDERPLRSVMRALPELSAATVAMRERLLAHLPLDRDSLEAEVCQRQLVVVCGGGRGERLWLCGRVCAAAPQPAPARAAGGHLDRLAGQPLPGAPPHL